MNKNLAGWASSSQSPEQISNRIKGLVLTFASAIIWASARFFDITITADDVTTLATLLSAVGGVVWTVYGGVLALVTFFAKK